MSKVRIYLGEVETTRKTGQKILKGDESITYNAVGGHSRFNISGLYATSNYQIGYCSHYNYQYANQNYNIYHSSNNSDTNIYIFDDNYTSADDFKAYLAQQYAAGTPVTVWYVLAEPTTGIINEPIRKIGTYADEVSGITIPTIAGANTLSIGTTLQPSEVTVTYKGWHPVADVHEYRGGGTNLFDAEAAYGELYNDGVVSGTPQQIYAVKNYFTSDEIGKQLTISVYAESVTSNRVEMFVYINGVRTTSNSIDRGQQGTMAFTVIPTTTSDNWTITYGSGGDINSFSNLTVTEVPHWD